MTVLNQAKIKEELVVLLRNNNVFSTTERAVTTITEAFVGDGSNKLFTVNNLSIKNVRSVLVNSVSQTYGIDYDVNYITGEISFTIAPGDTLDIDVEYDYGADKIFGEVPRIDLTLSSYPRIGVQVTGSRTEEGALDGSLNYTDFLISVYVYANKSNDVDTFAYNVRQAVLANKKLLYYLRYITPVGETSIRNEDGRNNKIEFKTIDFIAPLNEEIN